MELDPKYCDVIARRWELFTSKQAMLTGCEQIFTGVASRHKAVLA
jgi:hypothetical protein